MKEKIYNFAKHNKREFWILLAIIVIGALFRLYKIDQYMTFLGDEGRDVIIVRRIFTELHPPLIGPGTSVGDMYLGPLYYYMMAIPLLIAGFSPVGPAVMVALLGVITITFIWWIGRVWFGKWAGIIASGLYAISPTAIIFSHSSWNPNIMPFFALLSIFSIWKVWKQKKLNWLITLGISLAFVLQSHYLGLLLLPTIFIFWFLTFVELRKKKQSKSFINKTIIGLICFLILMSPLLIFDFRHNFMNAKAIYKFFMERQINFSSSPLIAIPHIPQVLNLINKSLIAGKNSIAAAISSIVILAGIIYLFVENFVRQKNFNIKKEYWVLLSWLTFGLIGFGFYRQNIYDHYFVFLFPVPFLLLGAIVSKLISWQTLTKIFGGAILIYLVAINLMGNPLLKEPNRLMKRSMDVSKLILDNIDGKPFNLAVIAERNYEDGYRYFLELWDGKVLHADRWDVSTISDQLIVVCENEASKCDPTHSPKAEVANFGMTK
jgi:4-amino-4-deoxy-L-arabinose transferase-like glycosyltransferase